MKKLLCRLFGHISRPSEYIEGGRCRRCGAYLYAHPWLRSDMPRPPPDDSAPGVVIREGAYQARKTDLPPALISQLGSICPPGASLHSFVRTIARVGTG